MWFFKKKEISLPAILSEITKVKGKRLSVMFAVIFSFFLSGCFGDCLSSAPIMEKGKSLSSYLEEHYPVGADQRVLISDLRWRGYSYRPANEVNQTHSLIYKDPVCHLYGGSRNSVSISWTSDDNGKIASSFSLR